MLDYALDLFPLMAALLATLTCGLLGNFLVLRQESLLGDAISHAVLPGLVLGLAMTSSFGSLVMLIGAGIAGMIAVVLIELIKRFGSVEPGAAMGVVFSVMFALGVLLLEWVAAGNAHVDGDAVLYGTLETLAWFDAPMTFAEIWSWNTLAAMPRQVTTLLVLFIISVAFVLLLFKELRITAFDPALATSQGIHAGFMHYALMVLVAAATVASFEAVGSILVVAMLIAPAATARLLTDRMHTQIIVSLFLAILTAIGGYAAATLLPAAFGMNSVNAAGSMTVVAGLLVVIAAFASPSHGIFIRRWRRARLANSTAIEDLLAALWRLREQGISVAEASALGTRAMFDVRRTCSQAKRRGFITVDDHGGMALTPRGLEHAQHQVRRHRQWETYLSQEVGVDQGRVHQHAEAFEHLPLDPSIEASTDPHGKPIPPTESVQKQ
jgi:manganese/zinc/iron transport system permease protein